MSSVFLIADRSMMKSEALSDGSASELKIRLRYLDNHLSILSCAHGISHGAHGIWGELSVVTPTNHMGSHGVDALYLIQREY